MGCVRLELAALQVTFISRCARVRGPKIRVFWGSSKSEMVLLLRISVLSVLLVVLRGSKKGSEVVLGDSDSISSSSSLVPSVHTTQGRGLPEGLRRKDSGFQMVCF